MKRLITMLASIAFALLNVSAQENSITVRKLDYFQTDKKGNRVVNYQLDYNDRFDIYVIHIDQPSLKGSVVLTADASKEMIRLCKNIVLSKDKNDGEDLKNEDEDRIWDIQLMLKDNEYHSLFDKGKLATKDKVMNEGDSERKRLFMKIGRLTDFLDSQLREYQAVHPSPVVVYFYNSRGPNGLAGILRDGQGKEVDQTSDFAYTDTKDGAKVYTYHYEKTLVFDVAQPKEMQDEIAAKVKMVKYVEPEIQYFVTDAAPPNYRIALSDGKRMSTSDENDYKYRTKEMPKQRYDVEQHYEIFSIADKYTGYKEAIKDNFKERMEKGKRKQ